MAHPVSFKKNPDDADILLEMVEPSFHSKDGKPKGLYMDGAGSKKIDYVLVYERCQEKENKDDDDRQKSEKHEGMRQAFEASLKSAGLLIEHKEHTLPQVRLTKFMSKQYSN